MDPDLAGYEINVLDSDLDLDPTFLLKIPILYSFDNLITEVFFVFDAVPFTYNTGRYRYHELCSFGTGTVVFLPHLSSLCGTTDTALNFRFQS